jgi:rSAM/selenodomain-associated transferase 1
MQKNLLIVFAKEPKSGRVKTRLGHDIGNDLAAEVYVWCLKKLAKNLTGNFLKQLCYQAQTPPVQLKKIFNQFDFFTKQVEGDLGQKMLQALLKGHHDGFQNICIIGTDSPDLPNKTIDLAFKALTQHQMVLGPTFDGGYYLIGTSAPPPRDIFANVNWSTPEVFAKTIQNIKKHQKSFHVLEKWWDIDDKKNLEGYLNRHHSSLSQILNEFNS